MAVMEFRKLSGLKAEGRRTNLTMTAAVTRKTTIISKNIRLRRIKKESGGEDHAFAGQAPPFAPRPTVVATDSAVRTDDPMTRNGRIVIAVRDIADGAPSQRSADGGRDLQYPERQLRFVH